ncbi:aromatic-ring-hydroxylating dioxygenase subunit beta [Kluyvera intermedia]|uniref:aromatic-ring-hydroxylating dioxygenase subunit beta n=1 Tax=Kluyvera intermedia TaxID=61648 RepID=UPI0035236399
MSSLQRDLALQAAVANFYAAYHDALEQNDLMKWVTFLAPDCLYKVTSRENVERGWPLCFVLCENQDMAYDRAAALQDSIYFRQRVQQHMVSNLRITEVEQQGSCMLVSVTSSFTVYESINGHEASLLVTGKTLDILIMRDAQIAFKQRVCICAPDIISDSIVYPL